MMTNVISFNDSRGGLAYPFLPPEWQWQIMAQPLSDSGSDNKNALDAIYQAERPTLRWVKDDKVMDLVVPGMDTAAFLEQTGLQLSMRKGGYVLSKRLSRIMRPYRYWGFFGADEVVIDYNEQLNPKLWDGSGLVSRGFIQRLADSLELDGRYRRELLHSNRFEMTTLHAAGQDKAHVLVVDDLAVDLMFPAHSVKQELALEPSTEPALSSPKCSGPAGRLFIGLNPVHGDNQMRLDVQSLVNLHPFFQPEHLLAWAGMESELFLDSIRTGKLDALLNRLYDARSASDLDSLANWHVGEYIASGGRLMWFAGMVKTA
ncbi:MAG: hypothetical protein GY803_32080, partial [Chloroflexi bacterium]|nr:hypothetical protein [Chloroflexota bacterium]